MNAQSYYDKIKNKLNFNEKYGKAYEMTVKAIQQTCIDNVSTLDSRKKTAEDNIDDWEKESPPQEKDDGYYREKVSKYASGFNNPELPDPEVAITENKMILILEDFADTAEDVNEDNNTEKNEEDEEENEVILDNEVEEATLTMGGGSQNFMSGDAHLCVGQARANLKKGDPIHAHKKKMGFKFKPTLSVDRKFSFSYKAENILKQINKIKVLLEGGHFFVNDVKPIPKDYILPTIEKYFEELGRIFPKAKEFLSQKYFQFVGSTLKKDISGDIDIAIDSNIFKNLEQWDLSEEEVKSLTEKYLKRARSSTKQQLVLRAITTLLAEKINNNSTIITASTKTNVGHMFSFCKQFDEQSNPTDDNVQIDWNVGNIDWLNFTYYSDVYENNVKGLHRTQLLAAMFDAMGLTFSHVLGVKNKHTGVKMAATPNEAIKLLNEVYDINLSKENINNFFKLIEILTQEMSNEDFDLVIDQYFKRLDSIRCDIPEMLQELWLEKKEKLNLKGKFLPNSSKLKA